jgi:ankyrin repeat protein
MMTTADAFDAIVNGDFNALTAALDAGLDPNARDGDGWTLLMQAVYWNRLVDVLLSRGANVHLKTPYGEMALHYAASTRSSDTFRRIFSEVGARAMNFPNCHGWTPLHCLAYHGLAEQMVFALSHPGIDVSIRNHDGHTALEASKTIFRPTLRKYGDEEARWQPIRYTWIKLLMIPTRR